MTSALSSSEPLDDGALTIFVDGSMKSSPRRGGIGIRFAWIDDDGEVQTWDHSLPSTPGATNNQMELEAPSEALRLAVGRYAPFQLSRFNKVVIRTDSMYVRDNLGLAFSVWSQNQWMKRTGAAVLNVKEWKNLLSAITGMYKQHRLKVDFEWKQGKKGKHAKVVDRLAKESADNPSFGRSRPSIVRRKKSPHQVQPGSVRMEGQAMRIRIIQAQYLPPPLRRSRYKYEVVDESSPYDTQVDWAESVEELLRGHTYSVRMNDVPDNPRIVEVLEEIEEDLSLYLEVLKQLSRPATAREVAQILSSRPGFTVSPEGVRSRLDQLVDASEVRRSRATSVGRPYIYEVTS